MSELVGSAAPGNTALERALDGGLAGGALAGNIGNTASGGGDGGDETANSAVRDIGQIRGLSRDDGERSREGSDGSETHVG